MTLLLPIGSLLYVVGLITREAGSYFPRNDGLFVASRVLTLDATAVAAAANYFILGRTLYYVPWASPIDPRRATQIFIFLDWLIGIFVAVGLSHIYNNSRSDVRLGEGFSRVSLIMQIALYTLHLAVLGLWHPRVREAEVRRPLDRSCVTTLYACGVLVLIRCVYRAVEYFQGPMGKLALHEAYYYVFDALTIFGMLVLLNVLHPGKFFPEHSSIYLAIDGVSEVAGPGWSDGRKWEWAVVDPVGVIDWVKADKSRPEFWELERHRAEVSEIQRIPTA